MKTNEYSPQIQQLLDYFEINNPREVSWAHRINTLEELERETQNTSTMMIESDICYLPETEELVMAHYDDWGSKDISYDIWLASQSQLQNDEKLYFYDWFEHIVASKKGVKLDYKSKEVILPTLKYIKNHGDLQNTPIIFNADVLRGPGGREPDFDAEEFVGLIKEYFPEGILSLGFTTSFEQGAVYDHSSLQHIRALAIQYDGHVTFPIRACYVKESIEALLNLLENNNHTISIFNNEVVSNEDIAYLENTFDQERAFIDVWEHVNLPNYYK